MSYVRGSHSVARGDGPRCMPYVDGFSSKSYVLTHASPANLMKAVGDINIHALDQLTVLKPCDENDNHEKRPCQANIDRSHDT